MQNNKRLSGSTHVRLNFSQSKTSSLLRGGVKIPVPTAGGGKGLTQKIPKTLSAAVEMYIRQNLSLHRDLVESILILHLNKLWYLWISGILITLSWNESLFFLQDRSG